MKPVLFFTADVPEADRSDIIRLTRFHYPELMEDGYMTWSELRKRRTRTDGMSKATAEAIIMDFNKRNKKEILSVTSPNEWPSNPKSFKESNDAAKLDTSYAAPTKSYRPIKLKTLCEPMEMVPRREGERQLLFWTTMQKPVIIADTDMDRFILSPWSSGAPTESIDDVNANWSMPVDIACQTLSMENQEAPYPLRFLLSGAWDEVTRSIPLDNLKPDAKLCAVLLIHYKQDDMNYSKAKRQPRDVNQRVYTESFIPLFVFKTFSYDHNDHDRHFRYKNYWQEFALYSFDAYRVNWGDYRRAPKFAYYEMRNIMAHLRPDIPPEERWTMLLIKATGGRVNQQYLLRKRFSDDSDELDQLVSERKKGLEPVCIDWEENPTLLSKLKVTEKKAPEENCEYTDNVAADFEEFQNKGEYSTIDTLKLDWHDKVHGTNYSRQALGSAINMVDLNSPVDIPRQDLVVVADSSEHAAWVSQASADTGMGFTDIRHQLGVYEHNFGDISVAYKRWDRLTHDNPHNNPLTFLAKMWGTEDNELNGGVVNVTPPSRGETASSWRSPSRQSRGPTGRWDERQRQPQPQQQRMWGGQCDYPRLGLSLALLVVCSIAVGLGC